jgi:hypothetical protein
MHARLSLPGRTSLIRLAVVAGLMAGGFIAGCAFAAQPHMTNALNALQTARAELGVAERDKGGHLPIAIERVDQAINQVKLGMAAGG